MKKKTVIQHLIDFLEEELQSKPDNRGEIESLLTMYRFLPSREYLPHEPIVPTSLVSLRLGGATTYAFIVPRGGGFITTVDGKPLQVLTPQSPLGEALLGKRTGDKVVVEVRGQNREYLLISSV